MLPGAKLEPAAAAAEPGARFQFERQGYFYLDPESSSPGAPGVQPHRHPARHLGADHRARRGRREGEGGAGERRRRSPSPPRSRPWPRPPRATRARASRPTPSPASTGWSASTASARRRPACSPRTRPAPELFEAGARDSDAEARTVANWVVHELPGAAGEAALGRAAGRRRRDRRAGGPGRGRHALLDPRARGAGGAGGGGRQPARDRRAAAASSR